MLQKFNYNKYNNSSIINIEELNKQFENVCVFDSNKNLNDGNYIEYAKLIAIGSSSELVIKNETNALVDFQSYVTKNNGWLFGYLSYDFKNEIENLKSENIDGLNFPSLYFFSPKIVIEVSDSATVVHFDDSFTNKSEAETICELAFSENYNSQKKSDNTIIKARISKEQYIESVTILKQRILRGDIYEVNFCQEFYSENATINPVEIFEKLNTISKAPFAAFCKFKKHYLLSSSPERFIKKQSNRLISQPIKGTIKRSQNLDEDEQLKNSLKNNLKEQNENVMIVDLVRNDLSKIASQGSVNVDELFGVYSFNQVHQLISTVSCDLKENLSFTDIIKATFPMGSMTGAPKIRAMELIEQVEKTKRGLYSGAIGYISPNGDFDFSVVIRSILYNESNRYVSFMTGSAITAKANAEEEYEECLLKAKAMFEVLKKDTNQKV